MGEIVPLTSIRGVAALWVVAFHFSLNTERIGLSPLPAFVRSFAESGGFGVDIFFLLSGYILTANYGLRLDPGRFFLHRVARIFPLHIAVLSAMVAGVAAMALLGARSGDDAFFSWAALPYHFTLTFVWFGLPLAWNSPAWSLSAEWVAYFTFPALQAALRLVSSLTLTIALLTAQCAWLSAFSADTGAGAIGRAVIGFAAGASLFVTTKDRALPSWVGMTAAAIIVLFTGGGFPQFAVFPAATLLVALTSPGSLHRVMSLRPLKWTGDVSYSIYLIHAPLLIVMLMVARQVPRSPMSLLILGVSYLVVLGITSHLAWRLVERPCRDLIRIKFAPAALACG